MKEAYPSAPIIIGRGDALMLTDAHVNMSANYGVPIVSPPADRLLDDGETLEVAGFKFEVMEIPGHSPGHVVFYPRKAVRCSAATCCSAGASAAPTSPAAASINCSSGIRTKLWPLPDDTIVYPGHNEPTTIGHEKRHNPFLAVD